MVGVSELVRVFLRSFSLAVAAHRGGERRGQMNALPRLPRFQAMRVGGPAQTQESFLERLTKPVRPRFDIGRRLEFLSKVSFRLYQRKTTE